MGQLGDTLRERRTTLGISLEQAEESTRIRGKLLAALEAGDYARLPNPGYVRGYVSSYAKFLELDPVPLLAMYRSETGAGRYHDINLVDDEAVAPRGEQHAVPWKAGLIAVLVVGLLAAAIWVGTSVDCEAEHAVADPSWHDHVNSRGRPADRSGRTTDSGALAREGQRRSRLGFTSHDHS